MVGVVDGALPLPPWFEFAAPSIDTVDVFDNEVGEDAGPDEAGEVTVPSAPMPSGLHDEGALERSQLKG
jgi:hypothetical protein